MSDYTPTTEEIRERWMNFDGGPDVSDAAEFDRWLAAHDAEVLRKAAVEFSCDNEALSTFEVAVVHSNARHYLRERADLINSAAKQEGV